MLRSTVCASLAISLALLYPVAAADEDGTSVAIGLGEDGTPTAFDFGPESAIPPKGLVVTDSDVEQVVAYLRAKYPYRSLRKRLTHEQHLDGTRAQPLLSKVARDRLARNDGPSSWAAHDWTRVYSLAKLHSKNVREFITQEGFGIQRHRPTPLALALPDITPSPRQLDPALIDASYLSQPARMPVRAPTAEELQGDMTFDDFFDPPVGSPEDRLRRLEEVWLRMERHSKSELATWMRSHNPLGLPIKQHLIDMHAESSYSFASRSRNGRIVSLDAVAGFMPHAMTSWPEPDRWKDMRPTTHPVWIVHRVELVSLLKHTEPRVYESDTLPRMQPNGDVATRKLSSFESIALSRLQAGDDFFIEPRVNAIQMVGAIRAAMRCLDCHHVRHGELLGAFSYAIVREKPIRARPLALAAPSSGRSTGTTR